MESIAKPAPPLVADPQLARGESQPNAEYLRVREEFARVQERLAQLTPAASPAPPEVKVVSGDSLAASEGSTGEKLDVDVSAFRAAESISADERHTAGPTRRGYRRVLSGVVVAGLIVGAGAAWSSYGEEVKPLITSLKPQLDATWSSVADKLGRNVQGGAAVEKASADNPADSMAGQPSAASASPSTALAGPTAAEVSQMLQNMARDIALLQQGIEQLKAGQDQASRDNGKLAEQIKASQEQLSRAMSRTSEATLHPRPVLPTPLPKPPTLTASRRPASPSTASSLPPPQAIAPAAAQPAQADDLQPTAGLRPPKPVP